MKKFLAILVLGLLWCNVGFAECIKGDCNNGYGTYTWNTGDKYVGEWKDGKENRQISVDYLINAIDNYHNNIIKNKLKYLCFP